MENTKKLYQVMAGTITARLNCKKSNNAEWFEKHTDRLQALLSELPHGSGLDYKWEYDLEKSTGEKIILCTSYHAMNDVGYYDKIIDFTLTITPSLQFGFNMSIVGNFGKYQDIKDYLYDILRESLENGTIL